MPLLHIVVTFSRPQDWPLSAIVHENSTTAENDGRHEELSLASSDGDATRRQLNTVPARLGGCGCLLWRHFKRVGAIAGSLRCIQTNPSPSDLRVNEGCLQRFPVFVSVQTPDRWVTVKLSSSHCDNVRTLESVYSSASIISCSVPFGRVRGRRNVAITIVTFQRD